MYSLYSMIADVMPISLLMTIMKILALVMIFVSLKQFTGYSKKRLLWYTLLTGFLCFILFTIILAGAGLAYYYLKGDSSSLI